MDIAIISHETRDSIDDNNEMLVNLVTFSLSHLDLDRSKCELCCGLYCAALVVRW